VARLDESRREHDGDAPDNSEAPAPRGRRADLLVAALAVVLVALAAGVGAVLLARGVPILVDAPPLLAAWMPHVGPGTPLAVLAAVVVVVWGPGLAARLGWRPMLALAYTASLVWTVSLALVDGFVDGFATRLTTLFEYLHEVPRITNIPAFLQGFAALIPSFQPGYWTTHVAGHPPLATLIYVWLDRIGLGGGVAASTVTVLVGCSGVVAVAVALRALGAERAARAFLPFAVLFPGAVWVGVSADGMFATVFAWGVALTALAAARDRAGHRAAGAGLGLAAGVVLGASLFLSYGLAVALVIGLAVLVLARSWRPVVPALVGVAGVAATFAASGFWWYDGYTQLLVRYTQPGEFGDMRPFSYFVWANLAALVLVVGLATVVGLRRVAGEAVHAVRLGRRCDAGADRTWLVVAGVGGAALPAVALADLSGLSKGEVERIWLPFALWLLPAAARIPRDRVRLWLAAQAVVALAINHLLFTTW